MRLSWLVCVLPCVFTLVSAWNTEGHEAIGMTAMSAIHGKALEQIKRLMGGRDVVDVSGWAHRVGDKYPGMKNLHYQYQPVPWKCDQLDVSVCPGNHCLVKAITHFYGRLTNQPLVDMSYPSDVKLTDADVVKYLINLLGDLHMPLHLGFQGDDAGKAINITYLDKKDKIGTSLFNYWDSVVVDLTVRDMSAFWFSGWTHVNNRGKQYMTAQKQAWDAVPLNEKEKIFTTWAQESLSLACTNMYRENGVVVQPRHVMEPRVHYQSLGLLKNQILTAGIRLSFVLNSILDQREASKLRVGSGVVLPVSEKDKKSQKGINKHHWMRNLLLNFLIIGVILIGLMCASRFASVRKTIPFPAPTNPLTRKTEDKRS